MAVATAKGSSAIPDTGLVARSKEGEGEYLAL